MALPQWLNPIRQKIGHDLLLIPGVSAMIFNERNEVLLHRRSDTPGQRRSCKRAGCGGEWLSTTTISAAPRRTQSARLSWRVSLAVFRHWQKLTITTESWGASSRGRGTGVRGFSGHNRYIQLFRPADQRKLGWLAHTILGQVPLKIVDRLNRVLIQGDQDVTNMKDR